MYKKKGGQLLGSLLCSSGVLNWGNIRQMTVVSMDRMRITKAVTAWVIPY